MHGWRTHIYVENEDYEADYLDNEYMPDTYGHYIGTLACG